MPADRQAVRAVVLNPDHEVLLLRAPARSGAYWFTPGGGLERGENDEQGLRRELREELGLLEFALGPLLLTHHFTDSSLERRPQRQRIYLVECARFDARMHDPREALEVERMHWWPIAALRSTSEPVYPRPLAETLWKYLQNGELHSEICFE